MSKLDDEFNNIISNIKLPSDEEIKKDTWRANLSIAMEGVNVGKPGRILSPEEIENLRKIKRPKSEETRKKLSKPGRNKGRVQSEEEKLQRSIANQGINTGKRPIEECLAMAEGKSKYLYTTPAGIMKSRKAVILQYPEYTANQLDRFIEKGLEGFSRTPKDQ